MKLENFDEWFAIRPHHDEDASHLPGRLRFDMEEGIYLDTVRFSGGDNPVNLPIVGQTITGWLDYQRPATVIQPWLQSTGGMTFSADTPALREKQRFIASAVLKNVFLENIDEPIFTGLIVEHPAFHAWLNPKLVEREWSLPEGEEFPSLSVNIQPPRQRTFILSDGTQSDLISATRTPRGDSNALEEYSVLHLKFPRPVKFDAITRLGWRISALFEFLIGYRVHSPVYQLPTTHRRSWNKENREVIAEFWYQPIARKSQKYSFRGHSPLTFEGRSPVTIETLLDCVIGGSDELIYLADIIQSVEDHDIPLTQGYGELLGCLEAFDDRTFGSGSDANFKNNMKKLVELIEKHGTAENNEMFSRIKGAASNRFSLLKRLERLHQMWAEDDFRGAPDLRIIRNLRNMLPHGRGLEVSSEIAEKMIVYNQYLTALGRYHVLKVLGFTGDQVAAAFSWQAHRYGMFVPQRMIPKFSDV